MVMNPQYPYYPEQPGYGQPTPGYGQPQYPPQQPAPGYAQPAPGYAPQQPGYAPQQPGYAPQQPEYGQPGYGQPTPGYGQPTPEYGQPMAPGYAPPPPYATPGAPYGYGVPTPPRNNRNLFIGIGVAVVVVLIACVAFAARGGASGGQSTGPRTLYQDSLTDNPKGWQGTGCSGQSDGFHLSSGAACVAPIGVVGNADMSVTVTVPSPNLDSAYGVTVRATSPNSYYAFVLSPLGEWGFVKDSNGKASPLQTFTPSSDVNPTGGPNRMEIRASGSTFTLSINGKQLGQFTDSTFAAGGWGFATGSDTNAVYTNISIVSA